MDSAGDNHFVGDGELSEGATTVDTNSMLSMGGLHSASDPSGAVETKKEISTSELWCPHGSVR